LILQLSLTEPIVLHSAYDVNVLIYGIAVAVDCCNYGIAVVILLIVAIPDVEILNLEIMSVWSLSRKGQCRGLKVVNSRS